MSKATAPFKVISVDHIGLAPKHPQVLKELFAKSFNLTDQGAEVVEQQKTSTHFFQSSSSEEARLEILEAYSNEGPIAKFLQKQSSGIHHIALRVDDIFAAVSYLKEQGIRFTTDAPRKGAHNAQVIFLHPHSTGGILIELVQK